MKLLLVAGEFPPMQGGLGDFSCRLATALAKQGCDISAFVPSAAVPCEPLPFPVLPRAGRWGWQDLARLAGLLRRYDLVNLQYQAAAYAMRVPIHFLPLVCRVLGVPLVTTFHDLRVPYLFPKAGRLRAEAIRGLLRGSAAAILTNEEDLEAARMIAPATRLQLVRIGSNVEPAAFDADLRLSLRRQWGCREDATVVSYFAFLNASKGALDLVQAAAKLRAAGVDLWLAFIGGQTGASDPSNVAYAQQVQQAIDELGLRERAIFTGYLEPAALSAALYASDICALPYRDGASYRRGSLMAALAHGLPVVTTTPAVNTPGLSEGENIRLVPPADPAALATAIAQLATDASERARLSRAAKTLSRRFAWDTIARETLDVYTAVMTERGRKRASKAET
jgi:glycosyltransferase involved in cell wall biosynthesis